MYQEPYSFEKFSQQNALVEVSKETFLSTLQLRDIEEEWEIFWKECASKQITPKELRKIMGKENLL